MSKRHARWSWLFLTPFIIGMLVFTVYPMIFSVYYAFCDYNIFNPPKWVGLANFAKLLPDPALWKAYRNAFAFALTYIPVQIFLAIIFATALNQKLKTIGFWRVIYYLPALTPWVAACTVFTVLYNPAYGPINYFLGFFGLRSEFINSSNWFVVVTSLSAISIWKGVGSQTIYMLASMQNISSDVLEAADIDGAGPISKFFKIKMPLLTPMIFLLLLLSVKNAVGVFDSFYTMLGGGYGVNENLTVPAVLHYEYEFVFNKVGLGAAMSWITFAIVGILTIIQKKSEEKWVHYE